MWKRSSSALKNRGGEGVNDVSSRSLARLLKGRRNRYIRGLSCSCPRELLSHRAEFETFYQNITCSNKKLRPIHYTPSPEQLKMKLSIVWLATLSAIVLAAPADPDVAPASEGVLDKLMKRQCGSGDCRCTGATGSQCFRSCDCQTACCDDRSRLCVTFPTAGSFCRLGTPGK